MQKDSTHSFDRLSALIAAAVWLITLVIYTMTQAPTLSLWDCGEFIATSVILGIPHPPGTPVYVLIGRIFSMIPTFADMSARLNFLSVFTSSIAAVFAYLCGVRLLRSWTKSSQDYYGRALVYLGAASGALLFAFGRTGWNNAVEAEVYGMSMMLLMAILWLTLVYCEKRGTAAGDRVLLAVVYLAFLGIGVHMTTFLILPACALVFVLKKNAPAGSWFLLAALFAMEFYLIFAFSSRPDEIPFFLPILFVFLFYLFYALSFERIPREVTYIGVGFALSCLPVVALFNPSYMSATTLIGTVSFIALLVYALIILARYFRNRGSKKPVPWQTVVGALFVLVAAFMTALLMSNIKGYASFLVLSIVLLIIAGSIVWRHINLPILIALGSVSLVILGIMPFVYGIVFAVISILFLGLVLKLPNWRTALLVTLMAILGFSAHLYIPIRSAQDPYINENDPSQNLTATINFLERKQYGSQSMIERMFKRRSEWENQFGAHRRMGFWSFFQEQYGTSGPRFFALFVIGLFGIWEIVRRRKETGLFVVILLLISSIGLVLYMNFADGTRQDPITGRDYIEVRDRDYFFTPAFMLFGLAIGIGLSGLVHFVRDSIVRLSPSLRKVILATCLLLFFAPTLALAGNWYFSDRSENYVAYDYAWNLLMTADDNAVLFTNGDNDTFPLWCLQEAYGVRKDVRVVNLTLSNLKWYIKQIQDYMGLNLGWTDRQIDDLRPFRLRDGRVFRLQDQLADAIIDNNPTVPINFSVTVGGSARVYRGMRIDSMLTLSGLKFRFDRNTTQLSVEVDESIAYLKDSLRFRYASLADTNIYMNETTRRVVGNVSNSLYMNLEGIRRAGRTDDAIEVANRALRLTPSSNRIARILIELYVEKGHTDSIRALQELSTGVDPRELRLAIARAYRKIDEREKATEVLEQLMTEFPTYRPALDETMKMLVQMQDAEKMITVLQRWLEHNPQDVQLKEALQELLDQIDKLEELSGDSR